MLAQGLTQAVNHTYTAYVQTYHKITNEGRKHLIIIRFSYQYHLIMYFKPIHSADVAF